jgi:ribosomal protein S18 acetylase RimI-like enzyme
VTLTRVQLPTRRISSSTAETPFEVVEGFNERWWNRHLVQGERLEWFSFLDVGGTEVARADCIPVAHIGNAYTGVSIPADGFMEITFLEVREGTRRQGVGREAVHLLEETHPGRQLAAFSEHADEFWDALGWQRHIRPNRNPELYRSLFVSPVAVR